MQQLMVNHHSLMPRFFLLALLLVSIAPVYAKEIKTTVKDQKELSLTVYNRDLALIRDVRQLDINKGINKIAVREVSAQIRPETAIITSLSHPDSLSLLEQNFDYDLVLAMASWVGTSKVTTR